MLVFKPYFKIANLFWTGVKTFSKYKGNPKMKGSPLYGEKVNFWNKQLFAKPLRELSDEELSRFCSSVMLTWGETEDYKHFLPRIYEIIAQGSSVIQEWFVFEKLNNAKWKEWEIEEQNAVQMYFSNLWENLISDPEDKFDVLLDDYFGSIANIYEPFDELLHVWEQNITESASRKIGNYFIDNYNVIFIKNKLPGMKENLVRGEKLLNWITSDKMQKRIENDFFKYSEQKFAAKLSMLNEIILANKSCT